MDALRCVLLLGLGPMSLCAEPLPGQAVVAAPPSLNSARQAFASGNLSAAEDQVRGLLQSSPGSAPAMTLLAYVLQARNQPRESLQWFTKAAQQRTPTSEDLRVVALDYILLNDTADALRWLNRSVAMNANNAEAWYDLARTHMIGADYPSAEIAIHHALALKPRMAKAHNNLGLILEAQNRPGEAARAYQQAIALEAEETRSSEQPLLNYGILLTSEGESPQAVPLLERAAALSPQDPRCHEALAKALDETLEHRRAAEEMERAVGLDPRNPRLHYQLGQIYRRMGQSDRATQELQLSQQLYGKRSSEPGSGP